MNRGSWVAITFCFFLTSSTAMAGSTTLVSAKSARNQSNGASSEASISNNGQFVAFRSPATNLAAARCNNGLSHIFVRDRTARTITCVSVNSNDNQGNQDSHAPSISSDGQFIAFDSAATNLTGGKCNNGFNHIFVRNRITGTTTCVSVHSNGTEGNGDSFDPSISSNGQMIAFHSSATNLTGRCTNGNVHVYLHDLTNGQTRCVSVDSAENQSNGNSDLAKISGDGLFVAFESDATNLTVECNNAFRQIFVRNLTTGRTSCASVDNNENQGNNDSAQPSISADGRMVAFESTSNNLVRRDTNGILDVFAHVLP